MLIATFITVVSLVAILYFVQLGARRGVFPVLLSLLVTVLAFIIAMNYRVDVARMYRNWFSGLKDANALALGYLTVFAVFFCLFGYLAVRYSPEIAPLQKRLDQVLGVIVGILAGTAIMGSLCMIWFSSTLAERYQIPEGRFYLAPHKYLVAFYGHITGRRDPSGGEQHFARFPGGVYYDAGAEITAMARKGSKMPRSGDGFWISSVPKGLRVFISSVRAQPLPDFKQKLEDWMGRRWEAGPVRGDRAIAGYVGRTPITVHCSDPEAWIAVETELSKQTPIPGPDENPLVDDGQDGTVSGPDRRFCKIYKLRKEREARNQPVMAKLVALMYNRKMSLSDVKKYLLPSSPEYTIKDDERAHAISELRNDGLSEEEAKEIIEMALRGGRVLYTGRGGEAMVFEITSADGDYRIVAVRQL